MLHLLNLKTLAKQTGIAWGERRAVFSTVALWACGLGAAALATGAFTGAAARLGAGLAAALGAAVLGLAADFGAGLARGFLAALALLIDLNSPR